MSKARNVRILVQTHRPQWRRSWGQTGQRWEFHSPFIREPADNFFPFQKRVLKNTKFESKNAFWKKIKTKLKF